MIDRLPPQSLEAEQSVLGAILIDRDAIVEVAEFLRARGLLSPGERRRSTGRCWSCSSVASRSTSSPWRRRWSGASQLEAIGGRAYLSSLTNSTPTAVHAVQYARIVERKAVLRNLIGAAGRIAGIGYEDPAEVQEAIDRAEAELFAVSQQRVEAGFIKLDALLHAGIRPARLSPRPSRRDQRRPDRLHGPRRADDGPAEERPHRRRGPADRSGKTSFALNIAEHAAVREKKSVGVFSLEMSKEQLVLRLLSSVANINSQRLRTGFLEELDFARIAPAMNALSEAPMFIDDTPEHLHHGAADEGAPAAGGGRPGPRDRRLPPADAGHVDATATPTASRKCRRSRAGSRRSPASSSVPVIALSQLSRQPEMRETKEPRLSDLRESGAIEQDADLVLFLWREKERGAEDQDADGEVINLKLAKHRNGPTGELQLWFKKRQTRFVELRRRALRRGRLTNRRRPVSPRTRSRS